MGAIGAICCLGGQPLDPQLLPRLGQRLLWLGPDKQDGISDRQAGLVQQTLVTTPRQALVASPVQCAATGCIVAADARIDNRQDLLAALDLQSSDHPLSDARLILAAYLRWQEKAPDKIIGDFAFAIWDPRQNHMFCARDSMGVRPLYYLRHHQLFACASHPTPLLSLPGVSSEHNEQRLACYLAQILPKDTDTFYQAVQRLPPGCSVKASANGLVLQQYWSPLHVRTTSRGDEREYVATFRELFTEAVRCRIEGVSSVGSTLSGGLDSSSITCLASALISQETGRKLHTFSAIFPSLPAAQLTRIDERHYMKEVRQYCRPVVHEIMADQLQPFATLASDVTSTGQPFFGPNMYIHNGMYEAAAQQGVKVFLDGTDGDSVVSYGFERFPQLLLTGRWLSLMRELSSLKAVSGSRQSSLRLLGRYAIKPTLAAVAEKLGFAGIMPGHRPPDLVSLLHPDLKQRVGMDELLHQHHTGMCLPLVDACANHRASLALPFLSHILEICSFFSARYGVEARYPFLDPRLVEFCLSLPVEQKLSAGWSRAIQRKAMSGLVPDAVLQRIHKADLSPNYYHGLAVHGPRLLEDIIRPSSTRLAEYFAIDRLLPRLEACLLRPEQNEGLAMLFFTVLCLIRWLVASDENRSKP